MQNELPNLPALRRSPPHLECGIEVELPARERLTVDATALEAVTVSGVRPGAGEPRELPVLPRAPRLGRAILNGIAA